jgi:hypothetical protein
MGRKVKNNVSSESNIQNNGQDLSNTNSDLLTIKDKINKYRSLGLREYPFLTKEQSKTNPFDPKKDNYAYLARKTMLVLSAEDIEELTRMGIMIVDGKSRVYGDHSILLLGTN